MPENTDTSSHIASKKPSSVGYWDILKAGIRLHSIAFRMARFRTITFLVVVAFIGISPIFSSYISKLLIDEIISLVRNQEVVQYTSRIVWIIIAGGGITVINSISDIIVYYFEMYQHYTVNKELTLTMTRKFGLLDSEHHENPENKDLLQKVSETYEYQPKSFLDMTYWLLDDVISVISSVIVLSTLSWVFVPLIVVKELPNFFIRNKWGRVSWGIWDTKGETKRDYQDTIDFVRQEHHLQEVKSYRLLDFLTRRIDKLLTDFTKEQLKVLTGRTWTQAVFSIISTSITVGMSVYIISKAIHSEISIGSFSFYVSTIMLFSNSWGSLLRNFSKLHESGLYVVDYFKVLDLPQIITSGSRKITNAANHPPKIEFRDVWFKYPRSNRYIFQNLNLIVEPGENIALVGKNGAGKSTLIKLLLRFYDVSKGAILIDGIDIRDIKLSSWYKQTAVLSQDYSKYHFDTHTNIALTDVHTQDSLGRAKMAAKLSGADSFIQRFEFKYKQILSKRYKGGTEPSEGQWQKIALARAFYKDAGVLILDEPTSAIDPKSEYEIFQKLFRYAEKRSVVIISHRFSTVRNASKIYVIDDGKIIEQGTHEQLMKLDGEYKEAFELQKKGYEE